MNIKTSKSRTNTLATFTAAVLAGAGLGLTLTAAATQSDAESILGPKEQHAKVSRLATTFFEHSHYRRTKIDDSVSSSILDRYLKSLDPNRMYFTASDVASFERFRTLMDDFVRTGRVDAVFDIFGVFKARAERQMEFALKQLDEEPDFTVQERYYFDREDSPWAENQDELDELWRKRVKHDLLSLVLAEKDSAEAKKLLTTRYERVARRYSEFNSDQVFESFMNAYADTLDPHSNYFSPRNADEYNIQMSLQYFGIGASLQLEDEYVTVQEVIAGGPAATDGTLSQKDRITGVAEGPEGDVVDVVGWRLDDVVELIRGPGDTVVRLQILPSGALPGSPQRELALTRGKVTLENQAAKKEIIELERPEGTVKLGVIKVPSFYQNYQARAKGDPDYASVTRDVARHIKALKEEGVAGVIMDLRNNGGGQLSEAVGLTGLFIDKGPIVQLREHNGQLRVYRDDVQGTIYDGPMVVLVNRFSASASEIFAAAIQDYGRGIVIGQTTFGKGSVQNIYPLDRRGRTDGPRYGQLHLTMGKYYRVTGGSTQHRGVEPDIMLPSAIDTTEVGESARDTALPWDEIESTDFRSIMSSVDLTSLTARHNQRIQTNPGHQFYLKDIEMTRELRDKNYVSLNIDERRNEREMLEARRLSNTNEWRESRGLEVVESLEDLEDEDSPDILLNETAEILADAVAAPLFTDVVSPDPAMEQAN
ncbi:MAG: carboxy terminal-processing peptidase [Gammaproteobacteria bacterium]